MIRFFYMLVLAAGLLLWVKPIHAEESAEDAILLSVTIEGNEEASLQLNRKALENLGPVIVETSTIWTEGKQKFTGVPLANVLAQIGIQEGTLIATAINDYSVEIPVSDALPDGPILAYLLDGKPMSVRDKGPIWLIYPFDQKPEYQTETIFSRSIWQLDRLHVVE